MWGCVFYLLFQIVSSSFGSNISSFSQRTNATYVGFFYFIFYFLFFYFFIFYTKVTNFQVYSSYLLKFWLLMKVFNTFSNVISLSLQLRTLTNSKVCTLKSYYFLWFKRECYVWPISPLSFNMYTCSTHYHTKFLSLSLKLILMLKKHQNIFIK